MPRRIWPAVASLALAACGAPPSVLTESATRTPEVATAQPDTVPPATAPPDTASPDPAPPSIDPPDTNPPATDPGSTAGPSPPAGDILDVGDAKPEREYDGLVRAALADLERWWAEEYPALYGDAFEPLTGGIYPAYPDRTDPIPGCGSARSTTYEEINQYGAFYCQQGDFLVYDDGADGILADLADEFGPSILAVVLAHEYGHVVQARSGDLQRGLPTITTEQQADCFAGAWVARAVRGQAPDVPFSDADVRTGLIAMITVRDPLGIDQFTPGGHGSAFDRVGAFQAGFLQGLERCAEVIDDPLPLVPNQYNGADDQASQGNAPFGYGEGEVGSFLVQDLNAFWPEALRSVGAQLTTLTLVPVQGADGVTCDEPAGDIAVGASFCPSTDEVFFDETFGRDLYERFGDFTVGYVLGMAWSEAAQQALASPLEGEERALLSDCLTGAWVADIIPADVGSTPPRGVSISPGDLDEAIQTALVVGDAGSNDDIVGSGFEKIASFRQGVLEGIPACTDRLDD